MPPVALKDSALRLAYSSAVKDGRLSLSDIKKLKVAAVDGGRITDIERRDLATIASKHKLSPTAAKIWKDSFGDVAPVQPAATVQRNSVHLTPESSHDRWEGYVHTTPSPHWRMETWSHHFIPDYSPTVTEVREGSKRYLEFAGGRNQPRAGRIDLTKPQPGTHFLGSDNGDTWKLRVEKQAVGAPWKLTLTREEPGGRSYPWANNRTHLGTTSNWSMFLFD